MIIQIFEDHQDFKARRALMVLIPWFRALGVKIMAFEESDKAL